MTPATPPMPLGDIGADQGPPGISALMGSPSPQATPSPTNQERIAQQLRSTSEAIQTLADQAAAIARQFPEFAEAAKAIEEACKAGRVKLVANQLRGLEGPPPPTAAV